MSKSVVHGTRTIDHQLLAMQSIVMCAWKTSQCQAVGAQAEVTVQMLETVEDLSAETARRELVDNYLQAWRAYARYHG